MGFLDSVREAYGEPARERAPLAMDHLIQVDDAPPYALAALNNEVAQVAAAPDGTRNHTLNRAGFNLAQLVAGGALPGRLVWDELAMAAKAAGLPQHEIELTLRSALGAGAQQPRTVPTDPTLDWLGPLAAQPHTETFTGPQNGAQRPDEGNNPWPPTTTTPTTAQSASTPTTAQSAGNPSTDPQAATAQTEQEAAQRQLYNRDVALEARRLEVQQAARRLLKQRQNDGNHPEVFTLDQFLEIPYTDPTYRVDGLWPTGGRIILAGQHKSGKSTATGNLIRSLLDGDPYLDTFYTAPAGKVVLIDNELDPRTLQRWLRDQDIKNTANLTLIPLRGKVASFDILDPGIRRQWADQIRGADVVIFDCLRPSLDALGLSEDKDAGQFLVAFDTLLAEAGASEAVIVHHMGHGGERSRGDSRILDWPDATWKILKGDGDNEGLRFFSAFGRDVDLPEGQLQFTNENRHVAFIGGTRKDVAAAELVEAVVTYVAIHTAQGGVSGRSIEQGVGGDSRTVRQAVKLAVDRGFLLQLAGGQGGGFRYVKR